MGSVFAARDVALDRVVAVKIIRPELATADAAERFVAEARLLARVRHPNVVPVHTAGEAGGFFYYVMDFVDGETLAQRIARGPIPPDEVITLGRDLLDAVEAVHRVGFVHRDIKPANIFLSEGRALLADFGISRVSGPQTVAQHPAEGVSGTPGYMPPEQALGWDITPRTDLYAVGMVLYEALTGQQWDAILPDRSANWSGIPRRLAPILRRALQFDPRMRWSDAHAFRQALWRTRSAKYRRRTLLLTVAGLVAGVVASLLVFGGRAALPSDLAVLPFRVEGALDPGLGTDLAYLVNVDLRRLDAVRQSDVERLAAAGYDSLEIMRRTHAKGFVSGSLWESGDSLFARVAVVDREGSRYDGGVVQTVGRDVSGLGCQVAFAVVRAYSGGSRGFRCTTSGRKNEAVQALSEGDIEFARQNWSKAEDKYHEALGYDSTWALTKWRLVSAQRWLRLPLEFDLAQLYREVGEQLGEQDRMLLDAWQTPFGHERIRKYEQMVAKYPADAFGWLTFGDDLQMRGALLGIPLDSAVAVVRKAVQLDSTLAPAYFDLSWAAMRLGDAGMAQVNSLAFMVHGANAEPIRPDIIWWIWAERFDSAEGGRMRGEVVDGLLATVGWEGLGWFLRFGPAFDVAPALADLSGRLANFRAARDPAAGPQVLANLHVAHGLALVALGRVGDALTQFDEVARILGSPEALLQAAQWRVLPGALGLPSLSETEVRRARQTLERLADGSTVATRAAWTLALDAFGRDEAVAAGRWATQVRGDTTQEGLALARHLEAVRLAELGVYGRALRETEDLVPLTTDDFCALDPARSGEPFLRTAVYLSRAQWQTQQDDSQVDGAWLWYENADIEGWPSGLPQAGEIDWAFSAFARFRGGTLALERGDAEMGCPMLRRVVELWGGADSAYGSLVSDANQRLTASRCRP
jgi:tetratricopeptide (TPR) repeat protein